MRSSALLLLVLSSVVALSSASAQQAQRGPDNVSSTQVPGIDVLPQPNMPFTGVDKIVWTRPIEGGGSITTYLEAKAIRDSQGRIYRERHRFGPENADPQSTLYEITILDPVNRTRTTCDRAEHLCHISSYRPQFSTTVQPVGPFDQGKRYLTRESLGNQWMSNLPVVGTLEKTIIQPGAIGNDKALTISREFWYSNDLKINLSVTRQNPSEGTQSITLTNVTRSEPDPSVFAVPSGYRVQDDRRAVSPQN